MMCGFDIECYYCPYYVVELDGDVVVDGCSYDPDEEEEEDD